MKISTITPKVNQVFANRRITFGKYPRCCSSDEFIKSTNSNSSGKQVFQYSPNTYTLTSQRQFKRTLQEGMKYLDKLSRSKKAYYDKLIHSIRVNSEGEFDLDDYRIIKTFMTFKKLAKYHGDIPNKSCCIDEKTPFLGEFYKDYLALKNATLNSPQFSKALHNLYKSIYANCAAEDKINLIPKKDEQIAQIVARETLLQDLKRYGIKSYTNLISPSNNFIGFTRINDFDSYLNDWNITVETNGQNYRTKDFFTPIEVILAHEFYHVKQIKPGQSLSEYDYLYEIGATLHQLMMCDEIFKKLYDIDIDETVEYKSNYKASHGRKINSGILANTIRQIMKEYGCASIEQALLTPTGKEFLYKNFL